MPVCSTPPVDFVAEPSAWLAIAPGATTANHPSLALDGGHHGAINVGAGVHVEIGVAVGSCLYDVPGFTQITVTGDVGDWSDGSVTGAVGLAVEQTVADLDGNGTLLSARAAASYGDKYTPLASYLALGSNIDLEVGIRVRFGLVKLGVDAFVSPPRDTADPTTTAGAVFSIGATGRPGKIATAAVAIVAAVAAYSFYQFERNRND